MRLGAARYASAAEGNSIKSACGTTRADRHCLDCSRDRCVTPTTLVPHLTEIDVLHYFQSTGNHNYPCGSVRVKDALSFCLFPYSS